MADEDEVVWPWGMTDRDPDPASRPWIFHPHGFLAAVLEDDDTAEEAKAVLREAGFADKDLRTYSGHQVLDDRERFLAQQGMLRRVVGEVTSDSEAVALFVSYARAGRSFLWVHVADRETANRAIRSLSNCHVLHIRYYGQDSLEDIHVR
jgi:hypothetical protein